jgi:hypothetical protein
VLLQPKRLLQRLHLLRVGRGSAATLLQTAVHLLTLLRAEPQKWPPYVVLCLVLHWCLLVPLQQHQAAILPMPAAIAAQVTQGCTQARALRCSEAGAHNAAHVQGVGTMTREHLP